MEKAGEEVGNIERNEISKVEEKGAELQSPIPIENIGEGGSSTSTEFRDIPSVEEIANETYEKEGTLLFNFLQPPSVVNEEIVATTKEDTDSELENDDSPCEIYSFPFGNQSQSPEVIFLDDSPRSMPVVASSDENLSISAPTSPSVMRTLDIPVEVRTDECERNNISPSAETIIGSTQPTKPSQTHDSPTVSTSRPQQCHNLPIPELKQKLAFCSVCKIQHSNHKLANICLAKQHKRQCWLCLEVLPARKEEFYSHCLEYHCITDSEDSGECPYCEKGYDFYQGINQHIAKVHFSESGSNLDFPPPSLDACISTSRSHEHNEQVEEVNPAQDLTSRYEVNSPMSAGNNRVNTSRCVPQTLSPEYHETQFSPDIYHTNLNNEHSFQNSIRNEGLIRPQGILAFPNTRARRMIVPPEQALNNVNFQPGETEHVPTTTGYFSIMNWKYQRNYQRPSLYDEANIETVENPTLEEITVPKQGDTLSSDCSSCALSSNSNSRATQQTNEVDFPSPDSFHGTIFAKVDTVASVEKGEDAFEPYKKTIIRINKSLNALPSPPDESHERQSSCMHSTSPQTPKSSAATTTVYSHLEQVASTASDVGKKCVDAEINNQSQFSSSSKMITKKDVDDATTEKKSQSTDNDIATFARNENNIYSNLRDELKTVRLSDNSRLKRRNVLDSLSVELECKRPKVAPSHSLVHNLHTGAASLSNSSSTQNILTFNKGILETNFNSTQTVSSPKVSNKEEQQRHQEAEAPPRVKHYSLSGGVVAPDAGSFFEQYVDQDKIRNNNHLKLLALKRDSESERENDLKLRQNTISFPPWRNVPPPTTNCGNTQYRSCARFEPVSMAVGHSNSTATICQASFSYARNPCRNSMPQQPHLSQLMPPPPVPPIRATQQLPLRKPSNPAFWDGLRARLLMSQGQRTRQSSEIGCRRPSNSMAHTPTPRNSLHHSDFRPPMWGAWNPRREHVVIKNPFEEEISQPTTIWPEFNNMGHFQHPTYLMPGTRNYAQSHAVTMSHQFSSYNNESNMQSGIQQSPVTPPTQFVPTPMNMGYLEREYFSQQMRQRQPWTFSHPTTPVNMSIPPLAPQYTENYQRIMNRLYKLKKSKNQK